MRSLVSGLTTCGRRTALLVAAVATALAAAGCSSFVTPPTANQDNVIGNTVSVFSDICVDGFGPNSYASFADESQSFGQECNPPAPIASGSFSDTDYTAANQGQLMIGYMVPDGASAQAPTTPDLPGITFTSTSDYATWLTGQAAPPTGYQWVAFISSEFTVTQAVEVHLTTDFTPAAGSDASPSNTFTVQQVDLGDRADESFDGGTENENGAPLDASRAVDCNEVAEDSDGINTGATPTGCEDDESDSIDNSALTVSMRELKVTAPSAAISSQAGTTATVPFTVTSTGSFSASTPFTVSATTNANGVTVAPADSSLVPSGTQTENVSVPLPSTLAPGSYTVTLNLVGANGACADVTQCSRTATATIDVTAIPAAPTAKPITPRMTGLRLNHKTLVVRLKLNTASIEHLTLQRRPHKKWIKVKTVSRRLAAGQRALNLRKLFAHQLKRPGHYRVRIQASDGDQKSAVRTVSFTIH